MNWPSSRARPAPRRNRQPTPPGRRCQPGEALGNKPDGARASAIRMPMPPPAIAVEVLVDVVRPAHPLRGKQRRGLPTCAEHLDVLSARMSPDVIALCPMASTYRPGTLASIAASVWLPRHRGPPGSRRSWPGRSWRRARHSCAPSPSRWCCPPHTGRR